MLPSCYYCYDTISSTQSDTIKNLIKHKTSGALYCKYHNYNECHTMHIIESVQSIAKLVLSPAHGETLRNIFFFTLMNYNFNSNFNGRNRFAMSY